MDPTRSVQVFSVQCSGKMKSIPNIPSWNCPIHVAKKSTRKELRALRRLFFILWFGVGVYTIRKVKREEILIHHNQFPFLSQRLFTGKPSLERKW